jgi:two-component system, chemotaxis family, chemotaxis protein CheY
VVDDKPQMRSIVGAVLSAAGVGQVCYAPDGQRALEVISSASVDAVFADLEMPVMNGLDLISAIRGLSTRERYIPVIMLTAHSDRKRLGAARDRGMTEFLCKPVTARSILSRLQAVIQRSRPFVSAPGYFGPDRRRAGNADKAAARRRHSDH